MIALFLPLLLVGAATGIQAQPVGTPATRTLTPGAERPAASVSDFAWLAGEWEGEGLGAPVTESWSRPQAGQMAGHFVLVGEDGVSFYELMQIVPDGDSLTMRLRHFGPRLIGWEDNSGKAVAFPLVAVEPGSWFFDGLTIRRSGADAMTVTVRMGENGNITEAPFVYRRIR